MYEEIQKTKITHIGIPIISINKQYKLYNNQFEPTQNSPPSTWKIRLNKRIGLRPMRTPDV